MEERGGVKFYPYKKGGGGGNFFCHAERGRSTTCFGVLLI